MSVNSDPTRAVTKDPRRHNFRVRTERPVLCFQMRAHMGLGEPFAAMIVDLSARGIRLHFDSMLSAASRIAVHMRFADPALNIVALASRVRVEPTGVAYRFNKLSTETIAELTHFVFAEATRLRDAPTEAAEVGDDDPLVTPLDPRTQRLVSATQHVRAAGADLKTMGTLLRQEGRAVPPAVELALACVREALDALEE
jgi:hypothetical protein